MKLNGQNVDKAISFPSSLSSTAAAAAAAMAAAAAVAAAVAEAGVTEAEACKSGRSRRHWTIDSHIVLV